MRSGGGFVILAVPFPVIQSVVVSDMCEPKHVSHFVCHGPLRRDGRNDRTRPAVRM